MYLFRHVLPDNRGSGELLYQTRDEPRIPILEIEMTPNRTHKNGTGGHRAFKAKDFYLSSRVWQCMTLYASAFFATVKSRTVKLGQGLFSKILLRKELDSNLVCPFSEARRRTKD